MSQDSCKELFLFEDQSLFQAKTPARAVGQYLEALRAIPDETTGTVIRYVTLRVKEAFADFYVNQTLTFYGKMYGTHRMVFYLSQYLPIENFEFVDTGFFGIRRKSKSLLQFFKESTFPDSRIKSDHGQEYLTDGGVLWLNYET
ncbi:MAG: hypothetical protein KDD50_03645 [Bdellovibrionales bacterium]|nr:hypothetical protein [Bdellovibrionales bacterium]